MKISSEQLRQIIKEEIQGVIEEQSSAPAPLVLIKPNGDLEMHNVSTSGKPIPVPKDSLNPNFYERIVSKAAQPLGDKAAEAFMFGYGKGTFKGRDVLAMAVVARQE